ncbi:LlaJI family restriction endonuclease [Sediminitomix flava]|uniref:LlaJI restriction endonuclease n=1 Tax=Sediminitomix flava TaxID=379075 RepID=A0A315ZAT5_SEDFL|nr:LlaJI family restriction endonuclease [Sediminitomix flava]PWJ42661.1 LlaJI restriction endonuclease [Sediminitomix flava]
MAKGILQEAKEKGKLKFKYVGLITAKNIIISVLPKYAQNWATEEEIQLEHTKLIIASLQQYAKNYLLQLEGEEFLHEDHDLYNEAATASWLLDDFITHGLWDEQRETLVYNGDGEINWERTIELTDPIFHKGQPYYVDTITHYKERLEDSIIQQLHQWAVSYCADKYADLLGIGVMVEEKYHVEKERLGEDDYLLNIIDRELHSVFQDRSIQLLKRIKLLISHQSEQSEDLLSLFGTKKFDSIWESACKAAFKDQHILQDKIEKPVWHDTHGNDIKEARKHQPDILHEGNDFLLVLDAKYYALKRGSTSEGKETLTGQPGIADVTKQIVYQKYFEQEYNDKKILNCFLFPNLASEAEEMEYIGWVDLPILIFKEDKILNITLCPKKLFKFYLGTSSHDYISGIVSSYEELCKKVQVPLK